MSSDNPFAPLPSSSVSSPSGTVYAEGNVVVSPVTATWPARCVHCNANVSAADFKAKPVWYPKWVIIVFLLSRLIGLILFFWKRRVLDLNIGLCEEHRRKRSTWMWGGGGAAAFGFVVLGVALAADMPVLMIGFALLFLGGLIVLALGARTVTPMSVEGDIARLKVGQPFLESLR